MANREPLHRLPDLPAGNGGRSAVLPAHLPEAVQVVQGRLFGMSQSKANQWIHVLLPALLAALRGLGDAPARSLTALAHRLAVSEEALAPLEEPLHSPLLLTTERNGAVSAPRTLLNRRTVTVARKRIIR